VSSQAGNICGGRNRPPAKASGKSTTCATASAAFVDSPYPIARPSRRNGVADTSTATAPRPSRPGVGSAAVNSQPMSTSGTSEASPRTSPESTRPPSRAPGPAGSVRT